MPVVKFDNGTQVEFDKEPTPADIDEVASKIGINQQAPSASAPKTDMLQSISDKFNSVIPSKELGKVFGTIGGVPLTAAKGLISGGPKMAWDMLKEYDYSPGVDSKKLVGEAANTALNVGSLLLAPETGGASLAARGAFNAALGGSMSIANSLSQGRDISDPKTIKDAAGSATFSFFLPVLGKSFSSLNEAAKSASGVTPQLATILKKSTPEEVGEYIQTALTHNANLDSPTPIGLASQKLAEAGTLLKNKIDEAGKAVGSARKEAGNLMLSASKNGEPSADKALSEFTKQIEEKFGHEIGVREGTTLKIGGETMRAADGKGVELIPLKGRIREISAGDQTRILKIYQQLHDLANKPMIQTATDVIHNMDDLIDWTKVDQYGRNHDPLEGTIQYLRGQLNGAIRQTAPGIAEANDNFSRLKNLDRGIGQLGGKDLQRGELLLRRVFSGDKSRDSMNLLRDIEKETGIDLVKQSALARFATENFGDESSRTLLQQAVNTEASMVGGLKRALIAPIRGATKRLLVPETESYAMNLAKGKGYANFYDQLVSSQEGKNLLRTYFNNVSAAHPEIGGSIVQGGRNLINNTTGLGI